MKIESAVQTDTSGVDFFHTSRNAYDLFELSDEDVKLLVEGISQIEKYKEIVIDFRRYVRANDYADAGLCGQNSLCVRRKSYRKREI